jgi:isoleucyl-tRNA synthetase
MSKHLGNILEPIPLMDRHGADAVRWFMLAGGSPWSARRVGHETLSEVVRKVLLTYWNTASFFTLYAETNGWDPATSPAPAERSLLDRWALAELAEVTSGVTAAMEDFDTQGAGRLLAQFVDDLSNWYVRRSRRRFWDGDPAALATLHEVLDVLTRLMAPFTPFVTDEVWARAVVPGLGGEPVDSVHLASWPEVDESARDERLVAQVALVRRLVELGRSARTSAKVRTRQPLARALVAAPGWEQLPRDLVDEVADELNVLDMAELSGAVGADLVDVSVKVDFRAVGRRLGKQVQAVAKAVAVAEPAALVAAYRAGTATVEVDGAAVPLEDGDLVVTETPREGWTVASGGGLTVALDLTLTPELERAGRAREAIRLIQEARKSTGLEVSDRIELWWTADGAMAEALREHAEQVAAEVLAVEVHAGETGPGAGVEGPEGSRFWLAPVSR